MDRKIPELSKGSRQYLIVVQGLLSEEWFEWLGDVSLGSINQLHSPNQTTILSEIPDQAALRGLLNKIWDLNLTLISVYRQEKTSNGGINEYNIYPTLE
jgi:hypothetical protein